MIGWCNKGKKKNKNIKYKHTFVCRVCVQLEYDYVWKSIAKQYMTGSVFGREKLSRVSNVWKQIDIISICSVSLFSTSLSKRYQVISFFWINQTKDESSKKYITRNLFQFTIMSWQTGSTMARVIIYKTIFVAVSVIVIAVVVVVILSHSTQSVSNQQPPLIAQAYQWTNDTTNRTTNFHRIYIVYRFEMEINATGERVCACVCVVERERALLNPNGTYVRINTTTPLVRFYIEMVQQQQQYSPNKFDDNKEKPNEPKMTPKADTLNWYLNLFMEYVQFFF